MNHGDGGRPGKGRRKVTEDEAELWRQLTHSFDKVRAKPRVAIHGGHAATPSPAPSEAKEAQGRHVAPAPRVSATPPPRVPQPPPPPAEFDRRALRQVATGKVPIDDVLDLHGLHQATAHARLRAFLVSSQAKGHRMVLVVTGKGGGASTGAGPPASNRRSYRELAAEEGGPSSRGVLRRSVPQWLDEPEFRAVVLGYAAAGARHGGDGALYIRLRRARDA
jgi:DNA-nicking Smr family endonuclease